MTEDDIGAEWRARDEEVRQRMRAAGGGAPGLASREAVAGLTGLEIMEAMLAGRLPYPHIAETMDFSLIEVEAGKAVFQVPPAPDEELTHPCAESRTAGVVQPPR